MTFVSTGRLCHMNRKAEALVDGTVWRHHGPLLGREGAEEIEWSADCSRGSGGESEMRPQLARSPLIAH
jgi:hypothetical protein